MSNAMELSDQDLEKLAERLTIYYENRPGQRVVPIEASLFEAVDQRFEVVDQRFETMQRYMDKRFNSMQWLIGIGFVAMTVLMSVYQYV